MKKVLGKFNWKQGLALGVSALVLHFSPVRAYAQNAAAEDEAYALGWVLAYVTDWDAACGASVSAAMSDSEEYAMMRGWIDAWRKYLEHHANPTGTPPPPPPPPPPSTGPYSTAPRPW